MNTKAKELNDFQASLLEGVKYAQRKKAKVKIENMVLLEFVKRKPMTKVLGKVEKLTF